MHSDFRWKQRFQNYQSALAELAKGLAQREFSVLEQAGIIQLFEMSFELAWKTLKDYLFYQGFEVNSPRDAIRQSFASALIAEPDMWLEALEGHNRFSHTYDKKLAEDAVQLIRKHYAPLLFALERTLKERLNE